MEIWTTTEQLTAAFAAYGAVEAVAIVTDMLVHRVRSPVRFFFTRSSE